MATDEPDHGPLQLVVVGFETTERFDGEIARELRDLRGRGIIRVLDARLLSRGADGELTETDLNEIIGEPVGSEWRPAAHLFGLNGAGNINGAGGATTPEAVRAHRRLRDRGPAPAHRGDRPRRARRGAARRALLGRAPARRSCASAAGGSISQGLLTPEVMMLVGAELQAKVGRRGGDRAGRGRARRGAARRALDARGRARAAARRGRGRGRAARSSTPASCATARPATRSTRSPRAGSSSRRCCEGAAAEAEDLLERREGGDEPPTGA